MSAPTCLRALPALVIAALDTLVDEGAGVTFCLQGQDRAMVIVPFEYLDAQGRRRAVTPRAARALVTAGFTVTPGNAGWTFVVEPESAPSRPAPRRPS